MAGGLLKKEAKRRPSGQVCVRVSLHVEPSHFFTGVKSDDRPRGQLSVTWGWLPWQAT